MLSNIVFIIILILLIIILIVLYFLSNDIRKNKNKINILESDMNAMRERLLSFNQKLIALENDLNNTSKKQQVPSQNFSDIFDKLGSINNGFFQGGMMNDEDEETESSEEGTESESESSSEDSESSLEDDESESSEEESEDDSVSEVEVEPVKEVVVELPPSPVEVKVVVPEVQPVVEEVVEEIVKEKKPKKNFLSY